MPHKKIFLNSICKLMSTYLWVLAQMAIQQEESILQHNEDSINYDDENLLKNIIQIENFSFSE